MSDTYECAYVILSGLGVFTGLSSIWIDRIAKRVAAEGEWKTDGKQVLFQIYLSAAPVQGVPKKGLGEFQKP